MLDSAEDSNGKDSRAAIIVPRVPKKHHGHKKGYPSCSPGYPEDCQAGRNATASFENSPTPDGSGQTLGSLQPDTPFQTASAGATVVSSGSDTALLTQSTGGIALSTSAASSVPSQQTSASSQRTSAPSQSTPSPSQPTSIPAGSTSAPIQSISTSKSSSPANPSSSSLPGLPQSQLSATHTPIGAIVGGLIGGLLFIGVVILAVWFVRKRRRHVAPSAEFMGGAARPSFLRVESDDRLNSSPTYFESRFGGAMPGRMDMAMMKEIA